MKPVTIMAAAIILFAASITSAAETVAGVAGKARAEARRWKPDAVLVEINAHPQADGTLGPGHAAMFTFLSPSAHQALVVAVADGRVMSSPMPGAQSTLPIPERFLDLAPALATAKKHGFGTPMQATLKVYPTETGNRLAWLLAGVPTTPGASPEVYVDATAGTVTTFDEISGRGATQQRAASALRQEKIPVDAPVDFASLERQADAMAAAQSPSFKLYQVELELKSTTLRIEQADFHYFRPAPPRGGPASGWEEVKVHIQTPRTVGGSRKYTNPGLIMGEQSQFSDPHPDPAPAPLVAPDEAIRRFTREPIGEENGSGVLQRKHSDSWRLHVELVKVGAPYWAGSPALGPTWRLGDNVRDPFFKDTAPKGKWVWWTITQHPDIAGEQIEFVYFDAATGHATSYCGETQVKHLERVPCTPAAARGGASAR